MLDAATEMFGARGYHSASMDQIADEVGISKPMLYAYFDSKEGLYAACLKRAGAEIVSTVQSSYSSESTAEQALWDGLVAYFEFVRANPAKWQLVRNEASYDVPAFQELAAATQDDLRNTIQELARMVSASTPGDPMADDELRIAASYALFGAASSLANRWLDSDAQQTPATFSTQLMNLYWLGLGGLAEGETWSPEAIGRSAAAEISDQR